MRFFTVILATVASLSITAAQTGAQTAAQTADGVGKAMAVIDSASASGQIGDRTLVVGAQIFIGDLVATDGIGEAQLLFSDGTRMVVGANSSLVIDEFVFRGKAAENKFAIRALGGAFRFISGESGDSGYSIRTPTATIGVRGTAFDFTVAPGRGTKLVLLEGAATLCGEGGDCATIATPCGLLNANTGREVEEIGMESGRVRETRRYFPYLTRQSSLLEPFRVFGHGCAAGQAGGATGLGGTESVAAVSPPAATPEPEPAAPPASEPEPGLDL